MKLNVAGENKEYKEGLTVKELIALENVETPEYVTVSLNDEFVDEYIIPTLKAGAMYENYL